MFRSPLLKFACLMLLLSFCSAPPAVSAPGLVSRPQGLPWREASGAVYAKALNDVKKDNWKLPDRNAAQVSAWGQAYSTVLKTSCNNSIEAQGTASTFGETRFSGHNYCSNCFGLAGPAISAFLIYEDKAPILWEIRATIEGKVDLTMEAYSYVMPSNQYVFRRDANNIRPQDFFWIPDSSKYQGYSYISHTSIWSGSGPGNYCNYSKATTSCTVYGLNNCFDLLGAPLLGKVKIQLCNHEAGVRIKRIKPDAADGYIAGCFYLPGANEWGGNPEAGRFIWLNGLGGADDQFLNVDVYIYDAYRADKGSEYLTRISYPSSQALENDIDGVTGQLKLDRQNGGEVTWDGVPPSDPEQLLRGLPLPPTQGLEASPAGPAVDYIMIPTKACGPRSFLVNQSSADDSWLGVLPVWSYALMVSKYVKTVISQGDRITLESPGIVGGRVAGKAAEAAYGAWEIKESTRGRIVFQATVAARVGELIDGFIVLGEIGSIPGKANYTCRGNWIGQEGEVAGPVAPGQPWLNLLLLD